MCEIDGEHADASMCPENGRAEVDRNVSMLYSAAVAKS